MRPNPTKPVIHLELHTGDLRDAVDFYTRLCGWQPERIHAGSSSYMALGMGNRVGGGVVECSDGHSLWLPYVKVGDIGETTEQARDLGGNILLEPREGAEGWRSVVAAPDGTEVAFWQQKNGRR
jgi:predicted enzyme related to lactoylglutathione lyase